MLTTVEALEPRLLLAGKWIDGERYDIRSPYSGELVARVPRVGATEARIAIEAAVRAMREPLPAYERADILARIAAMLSQRREEAARLICREAGKPLKGARIEVDRAVATYTLAAAEARKLAGEVVPMDATRAGAGKLAFTVAVPIGVVGAIAPFNFPLNLVAHKLAPALAAGCAAVLKPASQTPLSALLLAELAVEAGMPPSFLSVLTGPAAEIADELIGNEYVRLLSFTGSAEVGWDLRARAARKKVTLELGNSAPVLVEADAALADAAAKIAANAFSFAGQSCISVQRVYVRRVAYDSFVARLVTAAEELRVGDPADEEVDVGPVIDAAAARRILDWIDEAVAAGARVLTGGHGRDTLIAPTVIEGATPDMNVWCREVFGPVCLVAPYDTLDEGIELANSTEYGLQAGVFTSSLATVARAAAALDFGGVMVNEAPTFRTDQMPYGGVKASGNTREGPAYTVREMTLERLVVIEADPGR